MNLYYPIINDFTTLFLEKNLMKLYEREYIDLVLPEKTQYLFITSVRAGSWMKRRELFNNTNYKWVDRDKIEGYTPNAPVNDEVDDTSFPEHDAFVGTVNFTARPWLKYTDSKWKATRGAKFFTNIYVWIIAKDLIMFSIVM